MQLFEHGKPTQTSFVNTKSGFGTLTGENEVHIVQIWNPKPQRGENKTHEKKQTVKQEINSFLQQLSSHCARLKNTHSKQTLIEKKMTANTTQPSTLFIDSQNHLTIAVSFILTPSTLAHYGSQRPAGKWVEVWQQAWQPRAHSSTTPRPRPKQNAILGFGTSLYGNTRSTKPNH